MDRERTFWDYLAMGTIAGVAIGLIAMVKRRPDPMDQSKAFMERAARRVVDGAHEAVEHITGRFSG